jgi:hypothetical protein
MAAPKLKANTAADANVRHVAPYPISIRVIKAEGQPPIEGAIVKLTEVGFLMKVKGPQLFHVGDQYRLGFDLPATHAAVQTTGKVIKTYDGYETAGGHQVKVLTVEIHFKSLSDSHRAEIEKYLVQSGQKKR